MRKVQPSGNLDELFFGDGRRIYIDPYFGEKPYVKPVPPKKTWRKRLRNLWSQIRGGVVYT